MESWAKIGKINYTNKVNVFDFLKTLRTTSTNISKLFPEAF